MTSEGGPEVLVVSDGRAGIEAPALGLAEALGRPFAIHHVPLKGLAARLPPLLARPVLERSPRLMAPRPWPALVIGAGRRAVPHLLAMRGPATRTLFLGDPRVAAERFDQVIAPAHDGVTGANVVTTIGSLHRVTPSRLAEGAATFAASYADLPRPLIAVLIGGASKRHRLPGSAAQALAKALRGVLAGGAGLAITLSRRTPPAAAAILRAALDHPGARIWDGAPPNPYFGLLGLADAILVTADSVNMVSEACATGKPVMVVDLPGRAGKLDAFHAALRAGGHVRPFTGAVETWTTVALDDMGAAVKAASALLADAR